MEFLKITQTDGTSVLIPDNYVSKISVAAPTAPVSPAQPFVSGRITAVKYLDAADSAAVVVEDVTVAAYDGTNAKYEYGCLLEGGQFSAYLKN